MNPIRQSAIDTINAEAAAVQHLVEQLTDDFEKAVQAILTCKGKVIVTGMGKSGLIGKKIAATLASTGTPAFFMHPGEAYHGDLGMIESKDIVLAIANSGQTDEVLKLIPFLQYNKNVVIAMTGNPESTLAKHAHYHLNIGVEREACPLDLAPTSSTTANFGVGGGFAYVPDAVAINVWRTEKLYELSSSRIYDVLFRADRESGSQLFSKPDDIQRQRRAKHGRYHDESRLPDRKCRRQ